MNGGREPGSGCWLLGVRGLGRRRGWVVWGDGGWGGLEIGLRWRGSGREKGRPRAGNSRTSGGWGGDR